MAITMKRSATGLALMSAILGATACSTTKGMTESASGLSGFGKPGLAPENIPSLYGPPGASTLDPITDDGMLSNVMSSETDEAEAAEADIEPAVVVFADDLEKCDAIFAEITLLDSGLGSPAEDTGPEAKASAGTRAINYGKNLAVETAKGFVQPILQTKRAIMNDDEKERRAAEAIDRGNTRRAYLMGLADGIPCAAPPVLAADAGAVSVEDDLTEASQGADLSIATEVQTSDDIAALSTPEASIETGELAGAGAAMGALGNDVQTDLGKQISSDLEDAALGKSDLDLTQMAEDAASTAQDTVTNAAEDAVNDQVDALVDDAKARVIDQN